MNSIKTKVLAVVFALLVLTTLAYAQIAIEGPYTLGKRVSYGPFTFSPYKNLSAGAGDNHAATETVAIPVYNAKVVQMQIARGINGASAVSGAVTGYATGGFWLEGKPGTSTAASATVLFSTLTPMVGPPSGGTIADTSAAVFHYGTWQYYVEGLAYVRVAGTGLGAATQVVILGMDQ